MKTAISHSDPATAARTVRNYCVASFTMLCFWMLVIFGPRFGWHPDYWTFITLAAFGFVSGFVLAIGCALHTMRNIELLSPRHRMIGAAPLLAFGLVFMRGVLF